MVDEDGRCYLACRDNCGFECVNLEKFRLHAELFHGKRGRRPAHAQPPSPARHAKHHGDTKPYYGRSRAKTMFACQSCPVKFDDLVDLIEHKEKAHAASRSANSCPVCAKSYARKPTLWNHVKNIHGDRFRFKCPMCPMAFEKEKALVRHQQTKHVAGKITTCLHCPAKFVTAYERNVHVKAVHPAPSKRQAWNNMDVESESSSNFTGIPW